MFSPPARLLPTLIILTLMLTLPGCGAGAGSNANSPAYWRPVSSQGEEALRQRALNVCTRLVGPATAHDLRIDVQQQHDLTAYSWSGGRIALSQSLAAGNETDLAAALAHELGHLLADGSLCMPYAVQGLAGQTQSQLHADTQAQTDVEVQADAIAQHLLSRAGYPHAALPRLLQRLCLDTPSPRLRNALQRRLALLQNP